MKFQFLTMTTWRKTWKMWVNERILYVNLVFETLVTCWIWVYQKRLPFAKNKAYLVLTQCLQNQWLKATYFYISKVDWAIKCLNKYVSLASLGWFEYFYFDSILFTSFHFNNGYKIVWFAMLKVLFPFNIDLSLEIWICVNNKVCLLSASIQILGS